MRVIYLSFILFLLGGCNLIAPQPTGSSLPSPAPDEARLLVAWAQAGNLLLWQQGDAFPRRVASGGVVRPYIAPDGQNVLFTRGTNGVPETLWAVDFAGTAERLIVGGNRPQFYEPGQDIIGDIVWLEDVIFYFNTLQQDNFTYEPLHNLYRANLRTREVSLILSAGDGGKPHISPDGTRIAVVYPGTYGVQDGVIRAMDPIRQREPRNLLFFVGVATGSEAPFYPPVRWLPDSSAVLTAIPDLDLVYSETASAQRVPQTVLWRLPYDRPIDREQIGTLRSSFFGLPRWSDDAGALTFLQRTPQSNRVSLIVADRVGGNQAAYYAGELGAVEQATWIEGTQRFYYTQGTAGTVFIGGPGVQTQRLALEAVLAPHFVDANTYVYATAQEAGIALKAATVGENGQVIADVGATVPLFDARLID